MLNWQCVQGRGMGKLLIHRYRGSKDGCARRGHGKRGPGTSWSIIALARRGQRNDFFTLNFENPEQLSLADSLILADPALRDPNFSRAVLFLTRHSALEGAQGFILNRPLERRVGDLLKEEQFTALADVPVFLGGPVETEELTFGVIRWDEVSQRTVFLSHLSRKAAVEELEEGHEVRAFVGYAGWSAGQLEAELLQRSWIAARALRSLFDEAHAEGLWRHLLRGMGPWHRLLADMPIDPSLN
jgi:putative transcriptional regulator